MQQNRRGAPANNDNASNKRKGLKDGMYIKIFTNAKLTTELADKLAIQLGHEPSIEDIRAKIKGIYFNGLSEYLSEVK